MVVVQGRVSILHVAVSQAYVIAEHMILFARTKPDPDLDSSDKQVCQLRSGSLQISGEDSPAGLSSDFLEIVAMSPLTKQEEPLVIGILGVLPRTLSTVVAYEYD